MIMTEIAWWVGVPAAMAAILGATLYAARLRKRKQQGAAGRRAGTSGKSQPFDDLLAALIKQTEDNFQTVVEALHNEQEMFQEYVVRRSGSLPEKGAVTRLADISPKRKRHTHGKRRKGADTERVTSSDRYITHAARLGCSRGTADDSSDNFSPTQGELNLIADLQRIQQE